MTTATNNQTNANTNGSASSGGKTRAPMTPVDAIGKIGKILDQLSPVDRKRVLAFVSESGE